MLIEWHLKSHVEGNIWLLHANEDISDLHLQLLVDLLDVESGKLSLIP